MGGVLTEYHLRIIFGSVRMKCCGLLIVLLDVCLRVVFGQDTDHGGKVVATSWLCLWLMGDVAGNEEMVQPQTKADIELQPMLLCPSLTFANALLAVVAIKV